MNKTAFDLIHVYIVYKYIYIHYQCMKRCGENEKNFHPNPFGAPDQLGRQPRSNKRPRVPQMFIARFLGRTW